ncbi:MAG TPA: LysR family transcriptional regulator [Casimicrobiaceae bacterium]|jgi:DNA-binding transcriptional LysR family regulator|nr:LysR family transcriptional regulator [Casimicrobiaceae bacterium]
MDRLQAITAFAKVVESGSFARAAERLDVSVSSVSRQVSELESHLDARLLNRTTRRLSLTESGRAFYERCVQLLADLEEAEESASAGTARPRGTLRLTCGTTFGVRHLAPAIAEFVSGHPQMRFDVELSDRMVDLVDEGFDAALRIGKIGSQQLVGRKIGETRLICCASPAYLTRHGVPQEPEDLAAHACLTYEYSPQKIVWPFQDGSGGDRSVRIDGPVHANNGRFLVALAVAGVAITIEPDFIVAPEVRAGRLVPLLQAFESAPANIYLAYPSRRHLSAKVRAFADFLAARFTRPEWLLASASAPTAARGLKPHVRTRSAR